MVIHFGSLIYGEIEAAGGLCATRMQLSFDGLRQLPDGEDTAPDDALLPIRTYDNSGTDEHIPGAHVPVVHLGVGYSVCMG